MIIFFFMLPIRHKMVRDLVVVKRADVSGHFVKLSSNWFQVNVRVQGRQGFQPKFYG
jgi:hypothetical protein